MVTVVVPATAAADQDTQADIIRIATSGRTIHLDPIKSIWAGDIEAFGQLYSRLLRRDGQGKLRPGLAQSWESSEDGLEHIFYLREARFSDGSQITAEDVVFSLLRMRDDPESAYPAPVSVMQDAVAIDKLTVKITLKEPNAPFIEGVEMCFLGIVSKADIESRGAVEAFTDQPVTSGPYKVAQWKPNDRLILEPNPYYWREGFPKNDGVELIEVMDTNTRVAMLQSGDVDVVQGLTWSQGEQLDSHPDITVSAEPATRIWSINLNHSRPPFNDIRVRQAATLALDRELITRVITRGYARVANTVVPDTLMFHHSDYVGLPYDIEKAKNLIREAGVEGQQVFINIVAPGGAYERVAIILQAQWAEIGLRTTIVKMDAAMEAQRTEDGDYDASVTWWYNENSDPDLAMKWAVCSSCGSHAFFTWYQSAEADRLIAEGSRTLDADTRRKIYYRIQEIATDELAQIPLFYPDWINGYSKDIEGLSLSPSLQWSLEYAHHVQ